MNKTERLTDERRMIDPSLDVTTYMMVCPNTGKHTFIYWHVIAIGHESCGYIVGVQSAYVKIQLPLAQLLPVASGGRMNEHSQLIPVSQRETAALRLPGVQSLSAGIWSRPGAGPGALALSSPRFEVLLCKRQGRRQRWQRRRQERRPRLQLGVVVEAATS